MDEHQSDSDALASALGAIGAAQDTSTTHHFHHQLQAPDFTQSHHVGVGSKSPMGHVEHDHDAHVHGLHADPSQQHGHQHQHQHTGLEHDLSHSLDHHHHHHNHGGLDHSTLDHHDDHSLVDVHALDMVVHSGDGEDEIDLNPPNEDLDLNLGLGDQDDDMPQRSNHFGRPPSIRKACDLCHAAKQKCSGDRPSCTRCAAGGWACVYAPRQRRRTVPKEHKLAMSMQMSTPPDHQPRSPTLSLPPPPHHHQQAMKKRKLGSRESLGGFGSGEMDMKMAMGMAVDLGLTGEEEGEEMMTMTDEQMLESIAIDGYLADLPLATFVHNLPYTAAPPPPEPQVNFNPEDFTSGGDNVFPAGGVMDQHTTSALRDAIFSLNESNAAHAGHGDGAGDEGHDGGEGEDGEGMDPHLALLDLSHAMPGEGETENQNEHVNINFAPSAPAQCAHIPLVLHILHLLTSQTLEPKAGTNTPLTLSVFAPLSRSLRLFHALVQCPSCSGSPQQTLPQLALLSRTTTILTFPFPPISSSSVGSSAQITVHGARLSGTGLSEAIEQHIVGVVWDSWRAAIREIFANLERKAQEVISQSTAAASAAVHGTNGANGRGDGENGTPTTAPTGPETQRAGLMFQAMSRLVTAMDEVEDN